MPKNLFAKLKRRLIRYRLIIRSLVAALVVGIFIFSLYLAIPPTFKLIKNLAQGPAAAFSLVRDPEGILKSQNGRTNLLLLGMGGANHEGPQLTDSLVVLSIDLSSYDLVMLSVPRDIWIDSLQTKINATYYYGEQKKAGGGLILTKSAIEEVIGQPVHYALAIDFDGFKRAIDLVGGIEVNVPVSFDDYKYPIPGREAAEPEELRYEHLHFAAGPQTMSGEQALKYVRSRNAEGDQGTDFARSKRQQQVITAFKDKIFSLQTIFSPAKIKELISTFQNSLYTDLLEPEYLSLAKLAFQSRNQNLRQGILEEVNPSTPTGLLINPSPKIYGGQWVLIGKDDSWAEVHGYIQNLFYQPNPSD